MCWNSHDLSTSVECFGSTPRFCRRPPGSLSSSVLGDEGDRHPGGRTEAVWCRRFGRRGVLSQGVLSGTVSSIQSLQPVTICSNKTEIKKTHKVSFHFNALFLSLNISDTTSIHVKPQAKTYNKRSNLILISTTARHASNTGLHICFCVAWQTSVPWTPYL